MLIVPFGKTWSARAPMVVRSAETIIAPTCPASAGILSVSMNDVCPCAGKEICAEPRRLPLPSRARMVGFAAFAGSAFARAVATACPSFELLKASTYDGVVPGTGRMQLALVLGIPGTVAAKSGFGGLCQLYIILAAVGIPFALRIPEPTVAAAGLAFGKIITTLPAGASVNPYTAVGVPPLTGAANAAGTVRLTVYRVLKCGTEVYRRA